MSPFTDEERQQVRELHAQGMGRNEITRETGIHQKRVTAIAAEQGLSFSNKARTAVATRVRKIDAASRRAKLQEQYLESAERLMGQMFAPSLVYNFGGRDNTYEERTHTEPTFGDKRSIAVAVQSLTHAALRLAEYDRASESGNETGRSMLRDLGTALGQAYQQMQEAEAAADADPA